MYILHISKKKLHKENIFKCKTEENRTEQNFIKLRPHAGGVRAYTDLFTWPLVLSNFYHAIRGFKSHRRQDYVQTYIALH